MSAGECIIFINILFFNQNLKALKSSSSVRHTHSAGCICDVRHWVSVATSLLYS